MTPILKLSPNPIVPGANLRIEATGFDPKRKVQLALDGTAWTTNYCRPAADGTFHYGMIVSSTAKTQVVSARYADAAATIITMSAVVVAAVVVPPPPPQPPPPTGTTVANTQTALVAALQTAGTIYLSGDYKVTPIIWTSPQNLTIQAAVGATPRIIGQGGSTLVYCTNAKNVIFDGITFVGADVLQGDSNGSSLVGVGPGCVNVRYLKCTFLGSPKWTGNTQHLAYVYGAAGQAVATGIRFENCTFDGQGMGADQLTFYHPVATHDCQVINNKFTNTGAVLASSKGVQIWDDGSSGIVISGNDFSNLSIGVRHYQSHGTQVTGNTFHKSVGTPILIDSNSDAGNCTVSGNTTGVA